MISFCVTFGFHYELIPRLGTQSAWVLNFVCLPLSPYNQVIVVFYFSNYIVAFQNPLVFGLQLFFLIVGMIFSYIC